MIARSSGVRQISLSTPKSPKWDFQKVLFLGPLGGWGKSRERTFWISEILSYTGAQSLRFGAIFLNTFAREGTKFKPLSWKIVNSLCFLQLF